MGNVVVATAAVALAVLFWVQAGDYPQVAARFPRIMSGIVIAMALLVVVETAARAFAAAGPKTREAFDWRRLRTMLFFSTSVIVFVAVLDQVGYIVATTIFLFATFISFRATTALLAAAVTIGVTAAIYVIFIYFLRLPITLLPSF